MTRLRQYRFAIALFVIGAGLGAVGALLGFYFYCQSAQHFGIEVGKTMLALGAGVILGGAVKMMLDSYQATQQRQAAEYELRERQLTDLRNVHDQAETARLMISAHRSAKAYDEQMQRLIGCQVTLLKIKRSLDLRPSLKDIGDAAECLVGMIGYLRALQHEYTRNYSAVEDCQRYDTATRRHRLQELVAADTPFEPKRASSHDAWHLLNESATFPVLDDFTRCGPKYSAQFRDPMNDIAALLLKVAKPLHHAAEFDDRVERAAKVVTDALNQISSQQDDDPPPDADP